MATEIELYQGAYTGAQIDETLAAAETHIADSDVHLSSAQAAAISTALQPGALTSYPTKTDTFGAGTQIQATSESHYNLNNATAIGRYQCGLSVAPYVDNKPNVGGDYGFELEVYTNGVSTRLSQRLRFNEKTLAGKFFERIRYNDSSWTEWFMFSGDAYPFADTNSELQKSVKPTNLLKTQRYAALAASVHITPKPDGTYALGGTASGGTYFPAVGRLSDIPPSYVGQTLKLTGGMTDRLFLEIYNGSSAVYTDTGSGVEFTLTQEMLAYTVRLGVKKSVDCDGVIIKPMICVSGASSEFIPYTPTNAELRETGSRFNIGRIKGTSYLAIGDSITEYQGTTTQPHPTQNWVYGYIEAIEDDYGVTCTNLGVAGHKLIDDIAILLSGDYSSASIVTIAYGMNEAKTSSPMGDVTDTYDANNPTFCGALNTLIEKIMTDNPYCNVIVLSPNQRNVVNDFGSFTPNDNGDTLEDFANACVAVAAYRGVPCVDLFHTCGITAGNYSTMLKDGVHPSTAGYKRMYAAMRSALMNLVMPKD